MACIYRNKISNTKTIWKQNQMSIRGTWTPNAKDPCDKK